MIINKGKERGDKSIMRYDNEPTIGLGEWTNINKRPCIAEENGK